MRGRRLLAATAVAVIVVLGGAGCAAPRSGLGTTSSGCYRSLPAAFDAVERGGHLVGVRRLGVAKLHTLLTPPPVLPAGARDACLFAFRGAFTRANVVAGHGLDAGPFAIAVVEPGQQNVVAVYVLDKLPVRFRHLI